jgi:hypothetical protein
MEALKKFAADILGTNPKDRKTIKKETYELPNSPIVIDWCRVGTRYEHIKILRRNGKHLELVYEIQWTNPYSNRQYNKYYVKNIANGVNETFESLSRQELLNMVNNVLSEC